MHSIVLSGHQNTPNLFHLRPRCCLSHQSELPFQNLIATPRPPTITLAKNRNKNDMPCCCCRRHRCHFPIIVPSWWWQLITDGLWSRDWRSLIQLTQSSVPFNYRLVYLRLSSSLCETCPSFDCLSTSIRWLFFFVVVVIISVGQIHTIIITYTHTHAHGPDRIGSCWTQSPSSS